MKFHALAIAAVCAPLLRPGSVQALEPVGTFGEWSAACERIGQGARCVVTADAESWDGDKVGLVYYPMQRNLSVVVQGRAFAAQARVDRGPAFAADCLPPLCDITREGFRAAVEQGTVLFVTLSGAGKKDLTFAKNLLDLRKAAAAAKEWAERR